MAAWAGERSSRAAHWRGRARGIERRASGGWQRQRQLAAGKRAKPWQRLAARGAGDDGQRLAAGECALRLGRRDNKVALVVSNCIVHACAVHDANNADGGERKVKLQSGVWLQLR